MGLVARLAQGDVNLSRIFRSLISLEALATDTMLKTSNFKSWIKKLGFWGFLFFLVKGLLWLTIPAVIAFLAN